MRRVLTSLACACASALGAFGADSPLYPGAVDQRDGKAMIWCDLLYPLGLQGEALENCRERAEKALGILKEASGKQFDPELVDIFVQILERIEAINKAIS